MKLLFVVIVCKSISFRASFTVFLNIIISILLLFVIIITSKLILYIFFFIVEEEERPAYIIIRGDHCCDHGSGLF